MRFDTSFIGYDEDAAESCQPVQQCVEAHAPAAQGGETTYTAKNSRGRRALNIVNKKKQEYFINLMSAFKNFNSLLPSNCEISVRIFLSNPEKYFTTATANCKPTFKILAAKLIVEFILLKPVLLQVHRNEMAQCFFFFFFFFLRISGQLIISLVSFLPSRQWNRVWLNHSFK